jgi:zinc transporter 1
MQGLKQENEAEAGLLNEKRNGILQKQKHESHMQVIKLSVMISLTFCVCLVELFYGYFANSVALVADSFHMLSDVLALSVALACILVGSFQATKFDHRFQIAKRKSKSNTFGWVRAEVVGALVNGVFLLALCFTIFIESIEHILEPDELKEPLNVLIVGCIGLAVNIIGLFMFHGELYT